MFVQLVPTAEGRTLYTVQCSYSVHCTSPVKAEPNLQLGFWTTFIRRVPCAMTRNM